MMPASVNKRLSHRLAASYMQVALVTACLACIPSLVFFLKSEMLYVARG